jgi:glutamate dehydrogenase (NADP+)
LSEEQLHWVKDLKEVRRGRISEAAEEFDGATFHSNEKPWSVECDIAMPCATQNELEQQDAEALIDNGLLAVCEGANMPTTSEASDTLRKNDVLHAPGKASNAGGVAVSGLEMSQNTVGRFWSRTEVDHQLKKIMDEIHQRCVEYGGENDRVNYVDGANIAGFKRVADALLAFGAV